MLNTLSIPVYLPLFILCLAYWPGKSSVPRLVAAYLICLLIVLIHLPCYFFLQAYYRFRLYLIDRKLQRLDKQMQELGMNPND